MEANIIIVDCEGLAYRLPAVKVDELGYSPTSIARYIFQRAAIKTNLLHDGGLAMGIPPGIILVEAADRLGSSKLEQVSIWSKPIKTSPWQETGWFHKTEAWLVKKLSSYGQNLNSWELVSSYDMAVVLSIKTDTDNFYFKASNNLGEAEINAVISENTIGLSPELIAWDKPNNCFLAKSGGKHLSESPSLYTWRTAFKKLATFHSSMPKESFSRLHLGKHSFSNLAIEAERFLSDKKALQSWGLSDSQIIELLALVPQIKDAHTRINRLAIPETCCHGDAQPMNALSSGRKTSWFDWSEASIAHPFCDIGWTLAWLVPDRPDLAISNDQNSLQTLWEGYLSDFKRPEAKHLMYDAMLIALIHRSLRYHKKYRDWQGSIPNWKPQYVPYYLNRLMKTAALSF